MHTGPKPRIAVTGVLRCWDGAERAGVNAAYVRAVLAAGGVPLVLPPIVPDADADAALEGMDGVLLTGGEDVDPAHYAAAPHPALGTVSAERDRFELALVAAARRRGLPILGICRGIQLVNVALGGTLWQDLPSERPGAVDHDPGGARSTRTHRIRVAPGSRAAAVLGTTELDANSFHHQAVRDVAPGLEPTAWTDDGLVEAVESREGPWLLAVQWHPEEMHAEAAAPERGLFRALVEEARLGARD
ncbi:MAG TPA: gamma-glutamyl-gamma-aminobutyrate hydrolase family protein [Gemmatimonadales bacterium]|nr:gamma-glutamyl-gamma-aminobutyrate hydrolase family protein [Gemmatimonadales bacterium]